MRKLTVVIHTVKFRETLGIIVRQHFSRLNADNPGVMYRLMRRVARDSSIANIDRILTVERPVINPCTGN